MSLDQIPLLSIIIFLPLLGAILIAFLPERAARPVALVASAAILFAVIYLAHGVSLRTSAGASRPPQHRARPDGRARVVRPARSLRASPTVSTASPSRSRLQRFC